MLEHSCLKCKAKYQDDDVDDYLCVSCLAEHKAIASDLDGKFNTKGQEPNGLLVEYDKARGTRAFPTAQSLGFRI